MSTPRIIVAITGASGALYGHKALEILQRLQIETHLVVSRSAALTAESELGLGIADLATRAHTSYRPADVGAAIASGSFRTLGMLVAPCSIRTLGEISSGVTQGLVSRAADVCLKERRRLVLLVRESPLHLGHLRQMVAATEMGAVIAPPVPAFHARPASLEEMVEYTIGRALDLFGLDAGIPRWAGLGA